MKITKRKRSKKGQLTMFIILGIVVLFAFAFVFYIATTMPKKTKIPTAPARIPTDVLPVQNYVTSCLDLVAKEAIVLAGKQGGRIQLDGKEGINYALDDNRDKVAYWIVRNRRNTRPGGVTYIFPGVAYFSDPENYPWKNFPASSDPGGIIAFSGVFGEVRTIPLEKGNAFSIQEQLENYILEKVENECSDFGKFEAQGLTVNYATPKIEVTISNEDVVIKLNYPLEIKKKSTSDVVKMEEFYSNPQIRLKRVYKFANEISELDIRGDARFSIHEQEKTVNGAKIGVISVDKVENPEYGSIIIIEDSKTGYLFRFAIMNRRPAIRESAITSGISLATLNSIPYKFDTYAYDPDDIDRANIVFYGKDEDKNPAGFYEKIYVKDSDVNSNDFKTGVMVT